MFAKIMESPAATNCGASGTDFNDREITSEYASQIKKLQACHLAKRTAISRAMARHVASLVFGEVMP
jgi:hypothetical protein